MEWLLGAPPAVKQVTDIVTGVFTVLLSLFGIAAVLFAIYVGLKLAKAEEESKRKEAKQQLIWTIIAIIAVVVIIAMLYAVVLPAIKNAIERNTGVFLA